MSVQHSDVIVVGAGVIGLCTAWSLRQHGLTVCLLERGSVGAESSWAGAGILAPLRPWDYPPEVWSLVRESVALYPELADAVTARSGIDPELLRCGAHLLDAACLDRAMQWHAQEKLPFEAGPADAPSARAFMPWVMQVRNPRLCAALHRVLAADPGVTIDEGVTVHGLILRNGRVHGVESDAGDRLAEHTVIAAGAWSASLLPEAPPIFPLRGQMLRLTPVRDLQPSVWLLPEAYVVVRGDGTILVGSTMEHAGFDKSITAAARAHLLQHACEWLPQLQAAEVAQQWAGLRPGIATGIPRVGADERLEGLWWNTGHQRNGLAMAPASGLRLARQLCGGAGPDRE